MLDLAQFDTVKTSTAGAKMEVRNPKTGDVVPDVTITLAGRDSEQLTGFTRTQADRRIEQAGKGQRTIKSADIEADSLELLVACTLGWEGIALDGETLTYSADNA